MAGYNLGDATGRIRIEYDGKGVQKARNDIGQFVKDTDSAGRSAEDLSKAGGTAQKTGAVIAAGLGLAINSAAKFEERLSAVKAVSGATATEMDTLRQKALDIGKDTSFSASEGAQAIEELVKAGISVPDVMNGAADATVALAAAGEIDLPEAAAIASNAMNQFGLAAKDLPKVADNIAGAANASAIDVKDFGYSLSQVGAVANLAGATFEDTSTAIALLGNAGIKGSDAGTSLKSMLSNLQPTTEKQASLFKELGLVTEDGANKFYDAEGSLKSLSDVSGILQKSLKGMTDQQKQATLETLFGADGIRAAAILAEGGAKGFDDMAASMGKVTAADVAATRLDNFKGSVEALKGSLETMMIQIGTPLLGTVRAVVDGLTSLLNGFLALDPGLQQAIVAFVAIVGAALLVYGTFLKVKAAILAGTTVLAGFSLPVLAVIAAIAALVAAFVYFYKTNDTFRAKVQEIIAVVKEGLARALEFIVPILQRVGAFLIKAFQDAQPYLAKIPPLVAAIGAFLQRAFVAALPYIIQFIGFVRQMASVFINEVLPVIIQVAGQIGSALVAAFNLVWPAIQALIPVVRDFVASLIEFAVALYGRLQPAIALAVNVFRVLVAFFMSTLLPLIVRVGGVFVRVFVGTIGNAIRTALGIIRGVLNIIIGVIKIFTGLLTGNFGKAWDGVKQIFRGAGQVLLSIVKGLAGGLRNAIGGIKDLLVAGVRAIPGALRALGGLFGAAGRFIIDSFVNGIKNAAGLISGIAGNIWDFVRGLLNGAIARINSALEFSINPPGPGSININPPDIPALASGGVTSGPMYALIGDNPGGQEAVTPLAWLEKQIHRVWLAGRGVDTGIRPSDGRGGGGGTIGGSSRLRLVEGTLSMDASGRAFIRGVAEDVVDDEVDYEDRDGRRYR